MKQKKAKWLAVPLAVALAVGSLFVAPAVSVQHEAHAASSSQQHHMNVFSKEWLALYDALDRQAENFLQWESQEEAEMMLQKMENQIASFEKRMDAKVKSMHPDIQSIHKRMVMIVHIQMDMMEVIAQGIRSDMSNEEFLSIYDPLETRLAHHQQMAERALRTFSRTYQVHYSKAFDAFGESTMTVKPTLSYTVKRGNTLSSIAKAHGMTVTQLKSLNRLKTNSLKVGQVLQVHAYKTTSAAYIVQKGDTVKAVAQKYGLTVAQLKNLNKLTSNSLRVGQKLTVEWTYTAKRGDTLAAIAKKYGKTVGQLQSLNLLTTKSLKVGQVLRLN